MGIPAGNLPFRDRQRASHGECSSRASELGPAARPVVWDRRRAAPGHYPDGGRVSHVHQFYAWAVEAGLIEANPAGRLPVPQRPRMLPRPISEAELLGALAAAPPRIRPWLVLAGWAGLRAQEIAYLRREHVLDYVPRPVLLIDAAKGGDERIVPMSRFVLAELVPVLPRRGWVFPRKDGQPGPNAPGVVSRYANRFLHECGVTATLHQLRHRFGTQAYQASKDLRAVQELMGHRRPSTTAGYAAYDPAAAAAAVEAIPAPGPHGIATETA